MIYSIDIFVLDITSKLQVNSYSYLVTQYPPTFIQTSSMLITNYFRITKLHQLVFSLHIHLVYQFDMFTAELFHCGLIPARIAQLTNSYVTQRRSVRSQQRTQPTQLEAPLSTRTRIGVNSTITKCRCNMITFFIRCIFSKLHHYHNVK